VKSAGLPALDSTISCLLAIPLKVDTPTRRPDRNWSGSRTQGGAPSACSISNLSPSTECPRAAPIRTWRDHPEQTASPQNHALHFGRAPPLVDYILDELLVWGPLEPRLKTHITTFLLTPTRASSSRSSVSSRRRGVRSRMKHLCGSSRRSCPRSGVGSMNPPLRPMPGCDVSRSRRGAPLLWTAASCPIRKFSNWPISMEKLAELGTSRPTSPDSELHRHSRRNLRISGGTDREKPPSSRDVRRDRDASDRHDSRIRRASASA